MFRTILCSAMFLGLAMLSTGIPSDAQAGEVKGPQTRTGSLSPNDKQDSFTFRFKGGEQVLIIVNNTSNKGDIDLRVEDDNGKVVAKDYKKNDDASVSFTPKKTATYYVKVKYYKGPGKLKYTLTTN